MLNDIASTFLFSGTGLSHCYYPRDPCNVAQKHLLPTTIHSVLGGNGLYWAVLGCTGRYLAFLKTFPKKTFFRWLPLIADLTD